MSFLSFLRAGILAIGLSLISVPLPAAAPSVGPAEGHVFDTLEFKEARILDAVRVIAAQSGINIVATEAAGQRVISLYLRRASVRQAIESMSRVAGLWFNRNRATGVYTLMTAREYQDNLIVFRENYTRTFTLRHQNVIDTARAIKALFGDRVKLTIGQDDALQEFQRAIGRSGGRSGSSVAFSGGTGSTSTATAVQGSAGGGGQSGQDNLANLAGQRSGNGNLTPEQIRLLQEMSLGEGAEAMPKVSETALASVRNQDPSVYVTVNRLHNILYVRSSDEEAIDQIARVVAESDRPTPQVLLEMKVLELSIGKGFNSVFDMTVAGGSSVLGLGNSTGTTTGTLLFQVVSKQLTANLQILESQNRVHILATPMIMATNSTPAQLFIGEERVIVTGFSQTTTVGTTGATTTYFTAQTEQRDIGTTLRIVPRINSDRTVTLLVQHDDSTVNIGAGSLPVTDTAGNIQELAIDTVSTSNIQGVVTARDGLSVAMGGLIRRQTTRNQDRVPILADVPLLGFFFKRIDNEDSRKEIVVLITPHIFFTPAEAETTSQDRVAANSGNSMLPTDGFAASKTYGQKAAPEALIALARATRLADSGLRPENLQLSFMPLPAEPTVQLLAAATLQIVPRAAWRQGGLYATVATIRNLAGTPAELDPRQLLGRWQAVSFERPTLASGNGPLASTTGYFLSDRPFGEVIAALTGGGARIPQPSSRTGLQ